MTDASSQNERAADASPASPAYRAGGSLAQRWVVAAATVAVVSIGAWALRLQSLQARDIIRKHDIEDLEQALYRYGRLTGTYPPDAAEAWCGTLSAPDASAVRSAIENALRKSEKYAHPDKPFPRDPRFFRTPRDYTYWKTSPVSFELLAELEADPNNSREGVPCAGSVAYDYSVVSTKRTPF